MNRNSSRVALCGIVSALAVVLMFVTGLIPFLTYALPAIAGAFITVLVIEINKKWAAGAYAAVSLLSLLILADKEAALFFAAFFGYYPIIKAIFESKLPKALEWVLKLLVFNAAVVAASAAAVYIFGIPFDELEEYGIKAALFLLGIGNIAFVLYDYCLTSAVTIYLKKWQKHFRRLFK